MAIANEGYSLTHGLRIPVDMDPVLNLVILFMLLWVLWFIIFASIMWLIRFITPKDTNGR